MSIQLFSEFENQNSLRSYPFEDQATMLDTDSNQLPSDFIIDAQLYLTGAWSKPYLSRIVQSDSTIEISDSTTGKLIGTSTYSPGIRSAPVIEDGLLAREIGILVFGDGLADVAAGSDVRKFTPGATSFAASAFVVIDQAGVQGVVLPDGTFITGHVTFQGQDGVLVTEEEGNVVRIDILGSEPVDPLGCLELGPPIASIKIMRDTGSSIIPSIQDNILMLSGAGFDADDICAARKDTNLPDADGNLPNKEVPVTPPVLNIPPATAFELLMQIRSANLNFIQIAAPRVTGIRNAIVVSGTEKVPNQARLNLPAVVTSLDQIRKANKAFVLPPMAGNGIVIGFRGA